MNDNPQGDLSHHQTGRARRAYTGVLWSGLNAFLPALSGLIVFMVVSRVISPAEFGFVAFAVAVVGAIGAFSPGGFGDALVQRQDLGPAHLNATFWLCLLWGIGLYVITILLVGPAAGYLGDPMLAVLVPVVGLRLIFDLAAVVPSALLSRRMQFRQIAMRTLISSVVSLVVCLVVLWLGYGLWALVLSQLIGAVVVCVVSWLSVTWRPGRGVSRQAIRDLTHFGGFASGSRLITTINADQLLIGPLMGPTALGLFSFARRIFMMLNDVLTGALAAVSYPLLSSMQAEPEKLRETYLATTFLSSILSFPIFVGTALVADQLIPLVFGAQWLDATRALQAFCAIGLLSCIGILQAALIRAKGRADWWMWYQVVQQVLTVLVVVMLYPYGITAVVVGIAVKTWLVWPFVATAAGRMIDLSFGRYLAQFASPLLGCLVMVGVVLGLGSWMEDGAIRTLIVQIAAGVVTYAVTLGLTARHRLQGLRQTLRKKR
ncbi:MAG: lipopolysaccharide biosynthesis protein [Paracoccus sp. (in: a-proteobacteria)]|uniref:lipopolysaccharide biosynthesis protein n=1 Tax=Paracoccus sp. TaxID=267 RepID=UPI00391C40A4